MAWNYSAKEFIKVYRKFMKWEWYTDVNTKALFIHCLLRANWKPGIWQGIHYEAGEFITSLPTLAEETGLSMRQARTALEHLISTGELSSRTSDKTTGKKLTKNRILTVNNWDVYQGSDSQKRSQATGETSDKRQANDRQSVNQTTADIRIYKNNKNIKEYKELSLGECAFEKPTLEAVKVYCEEQNFTATVPEEFFDFYESKNWTIGKDQMSDWKASLRGWERRKLKENEKLKPKRNAFCNYNQRDDVDYDEFEREMNKQFLEMMEKKAEQGGMNAGTG